MYTTVSNFEPPILTIEIATKGDGTTHGLMSEYPEVWTFLVDKMREAVYQASEEIAFRQGAGPKALERRDARERIARGKE